MNARVAVLAGLLAAAALQDLSASQPPPAPPAATPPVLSTQPTVPPGTQAVPAEMSGMPLQVGDLPPGVVVVRVIRESFANNVAGQEVDLHQPNGEVRKAVTSADGRARFEGLRVGDTVHARTVVGGESLMSQRFALPAEGGVRLVLVAGVGAATPPGDAPAAASGSVPSAPSPSPSPSPSGRNPLVIPLVLIFVSAAAAVTWLALRPRQAAVPPARGAAANPEKSVPVQTPPDPSLVQRREDLYAQLVALERQPRRDAAAYERRRETLVSELISVETTLDQQH